MPQSEMKKPKIHKSPKQPVPSPKRQRAENTSRPVANGRAKADEPFETKTPWCKRDGHNRVCLACGGNAKQRPNGCGCVQHHRSFQKKQEYCRRYWKKNKARLLQANRRYRAQHPQFKVWAKKYQREWYQKNRNRKLAQARVWEAKNRATRQPYLKRKALEWYRSHRRRALANNQRYYRLNKQRKNSQRNESLKAARRNDPAMRILYNFRCRLSTLVRRGGNKVFSISRGVFLYTADQLRFHLQCQFTRRMNWSNYASYWEVDHIRPCHQFDLTCLEDCQVCFGLENLRPLSVRVNRARYHAERRERNLPGNRP